MCQNKKLIKKLLHEIRQQIVFDVKVLKNCDNLETLIIKTENLGHSEQQRIYGHIKHINRTYTERYV